MRSRQAFTAAIGVLIAVFLLVPLAQAQQRARSTQAVGTIAVTDTFQTAKTADDTRRNCTLQNTGGNTMYVYFGALASATKAASFQIQTLRGIATSIGGITIQDAVVVTGTSGDTFVLACQ